MAQAMTQDIKAALAYIGGISNRKNRTYAQRVLAYYRDYGTPMQRQSPYPADGSGHSHSAEVTIGNKIRSLMVGDCDERGTAVRNKAV